MVATSIIFFRRAYSTTILRTERLKSALFTTEYTILISLTIIGLNSKDANALGQNALRNSY